MMPSTASQTIHEVDLFFVINGSVSTAFNGAWRCYLAEGQASTLPSQPDFSFILFSTLWDGIADG